MPVSVGPDGASEVGKHRVTPSGRPQDANARERPLTRTRQHFPHEEDARALLSYTETQLRSSWNGRCGLHHGRAQTSREPHWPSRASAGQAASYPQRRVWDPQAWSCGREGS